MTIADLLKFATFPKKTDDAGIYIILNLITMKIYIGSTVDINTRIKKHKSDLKRSIHHCKHLQTSWNKYGSSNFEFFKIQDMSGERDAAVLVAAENTWINVISIEKLYNCAIPATVGPSLNDEIRMKLSISQKKCWENNSIRLARIIGFQNFHKDQNNRTMQKIINKEIANRPEVKIKKSNAMKKILSNEDLRLKKSEHMKLVWNKDGYRDRVSSKIKHGLNASHEAHKIYLKLRGEGNPNSFITEKLVYKIRSLYDNGMRVKDISLLLSISYQIVWSVAKRKSWKHI